MTLESELREDAKNLVTGYGITESGAVDQAIINFGEDFNRAADALAANAETIARLTQERDEARKEAAESTADAEHFSKLAFVDVGANPAIAWKDRAEKAEAERDAARNKALEEAAIVAEANASRDVKTACLEHDRGWENASGCIAIRIRTLKTPEAT